MMMIKGSLMLLLACLALLSSAQTTESPYKAEFHSRGCIERVFKHDKFDHVGFLTAKPDCVNLEATLTVKGSKAGSLVQVNLDKSSIDVSKDFIVEYTFGNCFLQIEYESKTKAKVWATTTGNKPTQPLDINVPESLIFYLVPDDGGNPTIGQNNLQGLYFPVTGNKNYIQCQPFTTNAKKGDCEENKPCSIEITQTVKGDKGSPILTFSLAEDIEVVTPDSTQDSTTSNENDDYEGEEEGLTTAMSKEDSNLMWIIIGAVVGTLVLVIVVVVVVVVCRRKKTDVAAVATGDGANANADAFDEADIVKTQPKSNYGEVSGMASVMSEVGNPGQQPIVVQK